MALTPATKQRGQIKTPPLKWSSWYLTALKLAVGLLIVLLVVLFWLLRRDDAEEQRSTLIADVLWLEQGINFHLEGNAEQLQQLANDLAKGSNRHALFEIRSQHLLNNNPDIQQVIWLDASAQAISLLPTQKLPRLGFNELGDEIQSRSIEMASKLGKTVYTDAYRTLDGNQFEVYSPIFENGDYRGVVVSVYSLNSLLKHMIPWWFAEKYQVRILDGNGKSLASKSKTSDSGTTISYVVPFDPPGFGMGLQVESYRSSISFVQSMISALIISLAAAVLFSLWVMRGHIHRRISAEQALRSEHAFRKAMEDSLTVGMHARNLEGLVTYANPAFCRMIGFSAEELLSARPPINYLAPEETDRAKAFNEAVTEGRAPREGVEFRFVRKDGSQFDALIHIAPLIDADGQHTGWMASIVDVTARKHIEELARQQQEKLQFTSRIITMGEMASTLAHELNQPLAAITSYNTGCINKLESGQFTAGEIKNALEKLGVQAQRAGRIIGRVHNFVRKSEPKLALCDLTEVIDYSVSFTEAAAKLLNIRIVRKIQGMHPELMADRAMLEQVLLNLMRNGIEAMSNVKPERRFLTIELSQNSDQMEIRVTDFGSGISPEIKEKLFTPFFSTKTEGMGMGLNICRSIIEFHHGRLWVEDNPQGGSIFVLTLPLISP